MSRYDTTGHKDGKDLAIAYGFDTPMQTYFFQVYEGEGEDPECLLWAGDRPRSLTNGQMLELVEAYGAAIPEAHRQAIIFDLPF